MPENPQPHARTSAGRFVSGVSGNPSGRPRSESIVLRRKLIEGADQIIAAVMQSAVAGDMAAARLVLERVLPALKTSNEPVFLGTPTGATPLEIARAAIAAAAAGEMAPDIAAVFASSIAAVYRAEEIQVLAARIDALEAATTNLPQKQKP